MMTEPVAQPVSLDARTAGVRARGRTLTNGSLRAVRTRAVALPSMRVVRGIVTVSLGIAFAFSPLSGAAQQAAKISRVGLLRPGSPPDLYVDAFRRGLHELGYVERQTIALEYRWAEGRL